MTASLVREPVTSNKDNRLDDYGDDVPAALRQPHTEYLTGYNYSDNDQYTNMALLKKARFCAIRLPSAAIRQL